MTHAIIHIQRPLPIKELEPPVNSNLSNELTPLRIFREEGFFAPFRIAIMNVGIGFEGIGGGLALSHIVHNIVTDTSTYLFVFSTSTLIILGCTYFRDRHQNGGTFFPLSSNTMGKFTLLKESPPLPVPITLQGDIEPTKKHSLVIRVSQDKSFRDFREVTTRLIWKRRIRSIASLILGGSLSYLKLVVQSQQDDEGNYTGNRVELLVTIELMVFSMLVIAKTISSEVHEYIEIENSSVSEESISVEGNRSVGEPAPYNKMLLV